MLPDELGRRLRAHPAVADLRLVVLHGSRARGDAHPGSDRDLAVLGDAPVDLAAVAAAVVEAVHSDAVDVVDLAGASALLRHRAARDGVALVERPVGAFLDFRLAATRFWCDVGPVVRAARQSVLADLP